MLTLLRFSEKDEPYSYSTENGLEEMVVGEQLRGGLSHNLFMKICHRINRAVCHQSEYRIQDQLDWNYREKASAH